MRFVLIFLIVTAAWYAIGHVATSLNGWILQKKLMKMYGLDKSGTERQIVIENQQAGVYTDPHITELIWDSLTWPVSVFYAVRGYRRLKRKYLDIYARETQPVIGGDSDDRIRREG